MIGLLISVFIQMIVLTIRLVIVLVVLMVRFLMWLIAAISNAISSRKSRRWSTGVVTSPARVSVDPDIRWAVFQRDGYACRACGSRSDLTVDHIHAVSLGGSNDPTNLQTLCRSCNSSKGARVLSPL